MTTLRKLCMTKKPGAILRKLNQLNIGLSNTVPGSWASKWSIGYHEPTLDDVVYIQKCVKSTAADDTLLSCAIDDTLSLQLDWTRHFGSCPTGPMM